MHGRWAAVGVTGLLCLAAAGLAGWDESELSVELLQPSTAGDWTLVAVASAAWVLAATFVINRTRREPDSKRALRRAVVVYLILFALMALLVGGFGSLVAGYLPSQERNLAPPREPQSTMDLNFLDVDVPYLLEITVGVALALVVTLVWTMFPSWRWLGLRGRVVHESRFGRGRRTSATPEQVLAAVVRARRALLSDEDVRRSIIAAYAAMEEAVAHHGVERRLTETPGEFLGDAIDQHVLNDHAAVETLLRLFHLARFSHEPMPTDAVTVADRCLAALQTDLERIDSRV